MADRIEVRNIEEAVVLLGKLGKNASKALNSASYRTRQNYTTTATKKLKQKTVPLPSQDIKLYFKTKKVSGKDGTMLGLNITGQAIPITSSGKSGGVRSYKGKKLAKGGISFVVRKDKGRERFKHAYQTKKGFFRLPTYKGKKGRQLYGPSIPAAFEYSGIREEMLEFSQARFLENIRQQFNRFNK